MHKIKERFEHKVDHLEEKFRGQARLHPPANLLATGFSIFPAEASLTF